MSGRDKLHPITVPLPTLQDPQELQRFLQRVMDDVARAINNSPSGGRGAAFPTDPRIGDYFYRTDLGRPYWYNGTDWHTFLWTS